jgi:elongation factor 1-beta
MLCIFYFGFCKFSLFFLEIGSIIDKKKKTYTRLFFVFQFKFIKMSSFDVSNAAGLGKLNGHLAKNNYVAGGYTPTSADAELFNVVSKATVTFDAVTKFAHIVRWYKHLAALGNERKSLPQGAAVAASSEKPADTEAPAAAAAAADDDDDDVDLFGSDDDDVDEEWEAEKAKRAAEAAQKKAAETKAGPVARSLIVFDVKPWEADTDMEGMEAAVRAIEMDGLSWKASEFKPVAYGVRKLVITAIVEDDKVSTDILEEKILEQEEFTQSIEIANFSKV